MIERILAPAIRYIETGEVISRPPPARHSDLLLDMQLEQEVHGWRYNSGFLTSRGRFVDRLEAYKVAVRAGQIAVGGSSEVLYTEDLW